MARVIEHIVLCQRDGQGLWISPDDTVTDAQGAVVEFSHIPVAVWRRESLWLHIEEGTLEVAGEGERDCMTDIRVEDIVRVHRVWSKRDIGLWSEDADAA